ncbi:hypothetical protein BN1708_019332 [Verticillium longisporum]|uniref:Uncharacterized protein n=1 Tax=Verticillium longisporum TaxID=100787 RepID=A0A0G4MI16_VERLO|nr:hypothetical protein BN1708_019332 [Verticillium longisporum]
MGQQHLPCPISRQDPRRRHFPSCVRLEVQLLPRRGRGGGSRVRRAVGGVPCSGRRFQPRAAVPEKLHGCLEQREGRPHARSIE